MDAQSTKYGFVMTFGNGSAGQLGIVDEDGDYPPEKSAPIREANKIKDVKAVIAGSIHSACLRSDGKLFTWGCNDDSALGRDATQDGIAEGLAGEVMEIIDPVIEASAGASHMLARTRNGQLYAWGSYRDGCGKMATIGKKKSPRICKSPALGLTELFTKPKYLPVPFVPLVRKNIVSIACTNNASIVVEDTGRVKMWGTLLFDRDRSKKEALIMEDVPFPKGIRIVKVFGYETSAGALDSSDSLWVMGSNGCGQLGFDPAESLNVDKPKRHPVQVPVSKFSPGGQHSLLLTKDGQVYSSGCVYDGRLGHGNEDKLKHVFKPRPISRLMPGCPDSILEPNDIVVDIASGYAHSMAVTKLGRLYTWGSNECACLGHKGDADVFFPKMVTRKSFDKKYTAKAVSAGSQHSMVLVQTKNVDAHISKTTPLSSSSRKTTFGVTPKVTPNSQDKPFKMVRKATPHVNSSNCKRRRYKFVYSSVPPKRRKKSIGYVTPSNKSNNK